MSNIALVDESAVVLNRAARPVTGVVEDYDVLEFIDDRRLVLIDRHTAGTLDALIEHLNRQSANTGVVVWEHNSHWLMLVPRARG